MGSNRIQSFGNQFSRRSNLPRRGVMLAALIAASLAGARSALAFVPQGLTNGTFSGNGGTGQLTVNTTLTSWTGTGVEGNFGSQTTPPVFVFSQGTTAELSSTGANGDAFMGNVKFYGATNAPGGGVVVAAMGDPAWHGGLNQTVNGLTIGTPYNLIFNWAGAQQQGFSGPTTEDWQVTLGAETHSTASESTPSQSFAGWQSATLTFTPTATSELLNFAAIGTPSGETPWLLLNNVALTAAPIPEPTSIGLLGIAALGLLARRRRGI